MRRQATEAECRTLLLEDMTALQRDCAMLLDCAVAEAGQRPGVKALCAEYGTLPTEDRLCIRLCAAFDADDDRWTRKAVKGAAVPDISLTAYRGMPPLQRLNEFSPETGLLVDEYFRALLVASFITAIEARGGIGRPFALLYENDDGPLTVWPSYERDAG